jgi:hypothetical protein
MSEESIAGLVKKARKRIWEKEPSEVRNLLKVVGTYDQNCMVVLYAESETRQLVDFFHCLRGTVNRDEADLDSAMAILRSVLDLSSAKFDSWYHLNDTASLFREVASPFRKIRDKNECNVVLEELLLYIGRLNFWIDVRIPWYAIIGLYEWATYKMPQ